MTKDEILKWWEYDPYVQSLFLELLENREKLRAMDPSDPDFIYIRSQYKSEAGRRNSDLKVAEIEGMIPSDVIEEMRNEIFTIFEQE